MQSRYSKLLLSLTTMAALALPAVAEARHGNDDPANHVRREHHRLIHHARHAADDGVNGMRQDSDDGRNHR